MPTVGGGTRRRTSSSSDSCGGCCDYGCVFRGESKGLLGYMYALGLGVEQDLNEAAEWFFRGATENEDPIGTL